jgi:hypothetical protein
MKTFTLTLSDDFLDNLIQVSMIASEDAHDAGKLEEEEVWYEFSNAMREIRNS